MSRSATRTSGRMTRRPALAALVFAALLVPLSWGAVALQSNFNASYYASWGRDVDRDGIDDRLEAAAISDPTGRAPVAIHYLYAPTGAEETGLHTLGAKSTYVMGSLDDIVATVPYSALATIRASPGVVAVEKLHPVTFDLDVAAPAVRLREASGVPPDGLDHELSAHEDHAVRGQGMVIAVVDTGVNNLHESLDDLDDVASTSDPKLLHRTDPLTGAVTLAGFYAGAGSLTEPQVLDTVGCVDPADPHGHGTHVAGIAVGTGGPSGTHRGAAPGARFVDVALPVLGAAGKGSGVLNVAAALDWVARFNSGGTCFGPPGEDRIDVLTMSIGGVGMADPQSVESRWLNEVARRGVTVVVAAGNAGGSTSTLHNGADGAIIVANADDRSTITRSDDVLAGSSSRGPRSSDDDAHALDELRPDVAAPGSWIQSASATSTTGLTSMSGTSMATPLVAGIAALVLQANPSLRPLDVSYAALGNDGSVPVRDVLQQTAQAKTATQFVPAQGQQAGRFGIPWNNAWGYGLVDAYAAVDAAS